MIKLGFYNHASTQILATYETTKNIRSIYPDAPIFISLDGNSPIISNLTRFRDTWNCKIAVNEVQLGYPPYNKWQVLEWLKRMYVGVLQMDCTHFCMVEDDCIFLNEIVLEDDWECVGHVITHGNKIPKFILTEIERISKIKPNVDYYGNGGGSIFRTKTFLENFHTIYNYFDTWWSLYNIHFHPQSGYMDCYMTLFYLLCGKPYVQNPRLKNLDPHDAFETAICKTASVDEMVSKYALDYDLVHNWKANYR